MGDRDITIHLVKNVRLRVLRLNEQPRNEFLGKSSLVFPQVETKLWPADGQEKLRSARDTEDFY